MNKKQSISAIKNYQKNGAGKVIAAYIYQVEHGKWTAVCHLEDNIGHIYEATLFNDGPLFTSFDSRSNSNLASIENTDQFVWIIEPEGTYCKLGYCDEFILINIPQ